MFVHDIGGKHVLYNSTRLEAYPLERLAAALIRNSGPINMPPKGELYDQYLGVDSGRLSAILRTEDDVAALCRDLNTIFAGEGTTLVAEPVTDPVRVKSLASAIRNNEQIFIVRPHAQRGGMSDAELDEFETNSRYYAALLDGIGFVGNHGLKALRATEERLALEKQAAELVYSFADERSKSLAGIYRRLKLAAEQVEDTAALAVLGLVDDALKMDRWLHSETTPKARASADDGWKVGRNEFLDQAEGRLYAVARKLNLSIAELWLHSNMDEHLAG